MPLLIDPNFICKVISDTPKEGSKETGAGTAGAISELSNSGEHSWS
jgi:hypothetical protein